MIRGGSERQPKRIKNILFKYLYTYVGTLRLGDRGCDMISEISNSTETKQDITDESPVNGGLDMYKLTDEF